MKFKEKDPIVSMEQWFPDKPLYYVKEVNADHYVESFYGVYLSDNNDFRDIKKYNVCETQKIGEIKKTKINLVLQEIKGEKSFVLNNNERAYSSEKFVLAMLNPSDYVLTYKSGRREVLTDEEKQERFE